jgi:hypothetical protein
MTSGGDAADPIGATMSTHTVTVEDLESWVLSGAHWRVVDISNEHAVVDMCTCTGEQMERVESHDPTVLGYLRTAHSEWDERRTSEWRTPLADVERAPRPT